MDVTSIRYKYLQTIVGIFLLLQTTFPISHNKGQTFKDTSDTNPKNLWIVNISIQIQPFCDYN